MNVTDKSDSQSWGNFISTYTIAFIVTAGDKDKQKYRRIIHGLLPEVLKQHRYRKNAVDFVLSRWNIASDDKEMKIISKLLKDAIRLAENGWLIALLSGVVLITTGSIAIRLLANNSQQPPAASNPDKITTIFSQPVVPDCVTQGNCTSLFELVELNDRYSPNFDKGELTVQFKGNSTSDDRLAIRNQGNNRGQVGINGQDVTYEGTVIGSFKGGNGENPLIVTFNTNATRKAAEAVVGSITYDNVSQNPNSGTRTVEIRISDGDGGISKTPLTRNISIIPKTNLELTVAGAITTKENSDLALNGINLSTLDDKKVTVVLEVSNGTLSLKDNVANGLTADNIKDNKTGKVILSGTAAQIKTTLTDTAALIYRGRKDFSGEDSLIVTGNINRTKQKGLVWQPKAQKSQPVSKRIGITVKPLNYPPVVTLPGNQTTNENTELAINGVSIKDPNNQAVIVTLEVSEGILAIKNDVADGLTADSISDNYKSKVTLKDSITKINKTLTDPAGIIYKGKAKYTGKDKLNVTADDGKDTDRGSVNIIVNDNPTLNIPENVTSSDGMTITKPDAVNLIKSWLSQKQNILGYPYDLGMLGRYTTGKYYRARKGASDWLKQRSGNYTFSSPSVKPAGEFVAKENQVIIDLKVYQKQRLRVRGKIDPTRDSPVNGVYRYTLEFANGGWKIADSEEIKK